MKTMSENIHPLMARVIRFSLLIFSFIIGGCAAPDYQQDFKPGTDFSQLKTYNWRKLSSEIPGFNTQQLQTLADSQLLSQGLSRTETDPDLLIDMTIVTRISAGASTGVGLSIGLPIGRFGSIGVGGGKSLPNDKQEGIIIVDFTEATSNQLIWRGSAEDIPMKDFSLKGEEELSAILNKLLSQFPPQ